MPLLYELQLQPRQTRSYQEIIKTFRIPFSSSLFTGWAGAYASEEKLMEIKWDTKKTTLTQVVLKVNMHAIQPFAAPSVGFNISVNGLAAIAQDWLGGCTSVMTETNIMGKIVNGVNTFKLEIHKNTPGLGDCGFDNILIQVEATWTGQPPEIEPPPETWLEKLMDFLQKNALWLGVGTVAIVGVTVVLPKVIEARRKPHATSV